MAASFAASTTGVCIGFAPQACWAAWQASCPPEALTKKDYLHSGTNHQTFAASSELVPPGGGGANGLAAPSLQAGSLGQTTAVKFSGYYLQG